MIFKELNIQISTLIPLPSYKALISFFVIDTPYTMRHVHKKIFLIKKILDLDNQISLITSK